MQTVDVLIETQKLRWTWAEVARVHSVDVKTIERDRIALDVFEEPITSDLLEEIRRMRRWCSLGCGRSPYSRRNYVRRKLDGTLEEKLTQLEII